MKVVDTDTQWYAVVWDKEQALWINRVTFRNIWLVYQSGQNLKRKKKWVFTVTATCVMEEFVCGKMSVTEDSMVPLI